eukprot:TRINITY_DN64596_c0_g1_i1.p1 TRINITY_DN64596_c0_g1~~TRINITY_DN64596_c0_g1_i1.p1  ORF type:complete len:115 (+),score=13.17 TRINITY_DN64596_c0_g1_i1:343-687(+)
MQKNWTARTQFSIDGPRSTLLSSLEIVVGVAAVPRSDRHQTARARFSIDDPKSIPETFSGNVPEVVELSTSEEASTQRREAEKQRRRSERPEHFAARCIWTEHRRHNHGSIAQS